MKNFKLLFLLSIVALYANAATPTLKIAQGKKESTTLPQHTIVGITDPGNKAFINGKEVHVYNTGTFGDIINLKDGANTISIIVKNDNESNTQEFTINYKSTTNHSTPPSSQPATPTCTQITPPLNVKTLPGAYLQFGDGSDRLGGSKMGYLEAGIPLKAISQTGDLYLVQLSRNRIAYIPKEYVAETLDQASTVNSG